MNSLIKTSDNTMDSSTLRDSLLIQLKEAVDASLAATHGMVVDKAGVMFYSNLAAIGPPDAVQKVLDLSGLAYPKVVEDGAELVESSATFNRFSLFEASDLPQKFCEVVWEPIQAHSAISMSVSEHGRFVTNVTLLRLGDTPPFSELELGVARRFTRVASQVLKAAETLNSDEDAGNAAFVVTPSGDRLLSGGDDTCWEDAGFREAAQEALAALAKSKVDHFETITHGRIVRLLKLRGDSDAVLINVSAVATFVVPKAMLLPASTRRVVGMIVRGCTVDEVAASLGRSRETVRTHLKRAYDELGIASRAELAVLVEESLPGKEN